VLFSLQLLAFSFEFSSVPVFSWPFAVVSFFAEESFLTS